MPMDTAGLADAMRAGQQACRCETTPRWRRYGGLGLIALGVYWTAAALAQDAGQPSGTTQRDFQGLDAEIQSLQEEVIDLNRELFLLEEELLFPPSTQVALFVSMDVGTFFALDSVTVLLDGKKVASYLYSEREAQALLRGGVHRLWVGNLKSGPHELTAFFAGQGPHERDYTRGASVTLDKGAGARYVELRISDQARQLQPEFVIKEWE